jgi:hypothetical protein
MKTIEKVIDVNAYIENLKCDVNIESGSVVAKIGFTNLAYGTITAIKFNAQGFNSFGDVVAVKGKGNFFLIIQDINIGKNEIAENLSVSLPDEGIRKLVLEESQICFADGSVTTYAGKNDFTFVLEEFDTVNSSEREKVEALRKKYGDKFKYKPKAFEVGWICGCGCLNTADSNMCMTCNTYKADALSSCSEDSLKDIVEKYRAADEDRKEFARQEAIKKKKEQKQRIIKIGIGIVVAVVLAIFISHAVVMSGRTTYLSEEEMKADIEGTYTYYDGYNAKKKINISGDTLTERWINLGRSSDIDLNIRSYNPKNGTFKASYAQCIVKRNGDIEFNGDLYEKGGYWPSSLSDSSINSLISSYETGYTALEITVDGVSTNSAYTICTGSVKNNGEKTYTFIEVKGSFKDSSGNVVDTEWTFAAGIEGLAPGESADFRIFVDKNSRIDSCSVSLLHFLKDN